MVRVGVLGAGNHSRINHGVSLKTYVERHPGQVELVAVCDLDQEKATAYARDFGFAEVYADLEQMVSRAALDGLVAITPMDLTEELGGRVLELGVPAVIEKPPGVGVAGAERLCDTAERTGTRHLVSFNRRFSPAFTRAREWMADGGHTPRLIASRMLRHRRTEEFFVRDTGIHAVDAVLSVAGPPREMVTSVQPLAGSAAVFHEARMVSVDGPAATFCFAPDAGMVEETMELLGEGFRVYVDFGESVVTAHQGDAVALEWRAPEEMAEFERAGSYDETAAFIRALSGEGEWGPTLADALVSMKASVAIQESGRAVLAEGGE